MSTPTFEPRTTTRRTELTVETDIRGAAPIAKYGRRLVRPVSITVTYTQETEASRWRASWELTVANVLKDGSDGAISPLGRYAIDEIPAWVDEFVQQHMPAADASAEAVER